MNGIILAALFHAAMAHGVGPSPRLHAVTQVVEQEEVILAAVRHLRDSPEIAQRLPALRLAADANVVVASGRDTDAPKMRAKAATPANRFRVVDSTWACAGSSGQGRVTCALSEAQFMVEVHQPSVREGGMLVGVTIHYREAPASPLRAVVRMGHTRGAWEVEGVTVVVR